jgi:hypothetical protein
MRNFAVRSGDPNTAIPQSSPKLTRSPKLINANGFALIVTPLAALTQPARWNRLVFRLPLTRSTPRRSFCKDVSQVHIAGALGSPKAPDRAAQQSATWTSGFWSCRSSFTGAHGKPGWAAKLLHRHKGAMTRHQVSSFCLKSVRQPVVSRASAPISRAPYSQQRICRL